MTKRNVGFRHISHPIFNHDPRNVFIHKYTGSDVFGFMSGPYQLIHKHFGLKL